MPPIDDNIGDLASSADPTLDAQDTSAPAAAPADAASSPAAPGETDDTSLLSVVRDVVAESRADKVQQPAPPADSVEETDPSVDDGKVKDPDDYSDVPFHKHPRFQQVVREKNAFKQDAERYNNVQTFMDQNNVGAEEAAELLIIGGLIKTNPVAAWDRMLPTLQKLAIAAGVAIPADLQDRVQKGELTLDAAKEVSKARATTQSVQATRSFEQQQSERRQQQDAATAITSAATTWEDDRRLKDPNFDAKLPQLMDKVYALQRQEGIPNTPQGVKDQLTRAYKGLVPAAVTPAIAPPRAKTPVRGGQVAGNVQTEPKSYLDIVRANRRSA